MLHAERFIQLADAIKRHELLWRTNPFRDQSPKWLQQYPELAQWLLALTDEQVTQFDTDPIGFFHACIAFVPDLSLLPPLLALPNINKPLSKPIDARQFSHIPGRKWTQISAFVAALTPKRAILEWCSGKGHLGRLLCQQYDQPVISLEWDPALCEHGALLAQRAKLTQEFICTDALSDEAKHHIKPEQHAVALHACGDLHGALIKRAAEQKTQALSISPCCYHLTGATHYQPFSRQGQKQSLALNKDELRIAVQEIATAPARVQKLRHTEMSFRLGYQALLEEIAPKRRDDGVSSCPKQLLNEGFAAFCLWASQRNELALPCDLDWSFWLAQGQRRWARVRRLSLVRTLFCRPLELYLVMDRACYLEEQGYQVTLSQFTQRQITPRNILIHAERFERQAID